MSEWVRKGGGGGGGGWERVGSKQATLRKEA